MSVSQVLLAVWLILVGLSWSTILAIDVKFLGVFALITGIILLVDQVHPIAINKR